MISTPPDAAVLFVHGIGTQGKGRTLLHHSRHLVRWLERICPEWSVPLEPTVADADITGSPPAVRLLLRRADSPGSPTATVLLTESHWADSFVPPRPRDTMRWLFVKAPALVLTRGADAQAAAWRQWWSSPLQWWRIVVAAVVAALAVPALFALLVTLLASITVRTVVPLPWLRKALGRLETGLTQVVGDSQVFSEDTVQRAALVTAVGKDLDRVAALAPAVLVVAHSQGAAIAVAALEGRQDGCSLVTLGSGLAPLTRMRRLPADAAVTAALGWLTATGLAGAYGWVIYRSVTGQALPVAVQAVLWLAAFYWAPPLVLRLLTSARSVATPASERRGSLPGVRRWRDIAATADPVCGGSTAGDAYEGVEEFRVRNRNSVWSDHSSYSRNDAEHWPRVVALLLDCLPERGAWEDIASRLDAVAASVAPLRHRQGRFQVGIRWTALTAGLCAGLAASSSATVVPASWSSAATGWLSGNGLGALAGPVGAVLRERSTGLVVGAGSAVAVWAALTAARLAWESDELAGRLADPPQRRDRGLLVVSVLMLAALTGGVAALVGSGPGAAVRGAGLAAGAGFAVAAVLSRLGGPAVRRFDPGRHFPPGQVAPPPSSLGWLVLVVGGLVGLGASLVVLDDPLVALGILALAGCGALGVHEHAHAGMGEHLWLRRLWWLALAAPWAALVWVLVRVFSA